MPRKRAILNYIVIILLATIALFWFLIDEISAVPDCAPGEWGILCQDYPQQLDGYYPLNSVVYFRIESLEYNNPERSDIGIVDAYFWDVDSQTYFYQILTAPDDPQNPYNMTAYKIVSRESVYHGQ